MSAQPPTPLRRAGLTQCAGMFAASFVLAHFGRPHAALAFRVAASLALALTLFRPRWLHAINTAVGRAVTVALLTLVYVVVIVPTRGALALFA
ncbi:MAG: hypothetical protein R3A52_16295 [Polyangiales bacterium]